LQQATTRHGVEDRLERFAGLRQGIDTLSPTPWIGRDTRDLLAVTPW
jgi:hypothetical protein